MHTILFLNYFKFEFLMLNLRLQPSTSFIRYFSKRKEVERYLERQANDQYSRRAKEHSYRARSAFKLLQINEKFNFIKPGKFLKFILNGFLVMRGWTF